jgi:hypothetical protein
MTGATVLPCLKFFDRIEWPELDVDRERNVRFIPPLASKQRQVA